MSSESNEQEIVWKLRAQIFEGDPRSVLSKARELLSVGEHESHHAASSEHLKRELYRLSGQVAKLAQRFSERAKEEERELHWLAEEVARLAGQFSGKEKEGKKREEKEEESEEEKTKKAYWRVKDESYER
jgi:hypothetical protein